MASAVESIITTHLPNLSFPLSERDLESRFRELQGTLPNEMTEDDLETLERAFQTARNVNYSYIESYLREKGDSWLRSGKKKLKAPLKFDGILYLLRSIEASMLAKSSKFILPSFDSPPKIAIYKIAESLIRDLLPSLLSATESFKGFIQQDAVSTVYANCCSSLAGRSQAEILCLENLPCVKLLIEAQYQHLLDLEKLPGTFEAKFMRKMCSAHLNATIPTIESVFESLLRSCVSGRPMDWDVSPSSLKGTHMIYVATVAKSLQTDTKLAETCLGRVVDWQRYPQQDNFEPVWMETLEAVCRLYMGLIALQETEAGADLETHPEIYLWLRRVLKAIYKYPNETMFFENRYLNVLNFCVGKLLYSRNMFKQDFRIWPSPPHRLPSYCQEIQFEATVSDSVCFRYLSAPSTFSVLHIGAANAEADSVPTELDVAREVLQWREEDGHFVKGPFGASILTIPLMLLKGYFLAIPLIIYGYMKGSEYTSEQQEKLFKKAECVGSFLGLLLVHRYVKNRFMSLLGMGIGAEVVLACLAEVSVFNRRADAAARVLLTDVVLFLGAVNVDQVDWRLIRESVRGRIINIHCNSREAFSKVSPHNVQLPIGCCGVPDEGVENFDVTDLLQGQTSITQKVFQKVWKRVNYYP